MDCNKKYYTYVLICSDNTLYTGFTTDITKRIKTHNSKKGAKYTRTRIPVKLIYYEVFDDKSSALKKERVIKKMKRQVKFDYIRNNIKLDKEEVINKINEEV